MKKIWFFIFFLIITSQLFSSSSKVGSSTASLGMVSTVPAGTGVVVPEGVNLVGNLAIQYQYGDGTPWEYISTKELNIRTLGVVDDRVYLQALYYGNETRTYSCSVVFSSEGWKLNSAPKDSAAKLPIAFTDLNVVTNERFTSTATDNGFSLVVPVSEPINGAQVASIMASWGTGSLPSGDYSAAIEIAVTSP